MTRYRRRGVSLTQLLGMLPIIGAMLAVGFQVTNRIVQVQGHIGRELADDAKLSDLVRRVQLDAEHANTASIESKEAESTLRFPEVTYRVSGQQVIRTERSAGGPAVSYPWTFEQVQVRFSVESLADRPRLVWVTFSTQVSAARGPMLPRSCSAAAAIGSGGAS